MKNEYKEMAIRNLYGMVVGSSDILISSFNKNFKNRFGFQPDLYEIKQIDKLVDNENGRSIWVGRMEAKLVIDDKIFEVYRDLNEEFEIDKKHPMYDDDYFYEGPYCESHLRAMELIEQLNK
jgi:hypothetical protein